MRGNRVGFMRSSELVTVAVTLISIAAESTGSFLSPPSAGNLGNDSFRVFPSLLEPAEQSLVLDRLGHQEEDEIVSVLCAYFCDSEATKVQQAVSKALEVAPRQLGDIKLVKTNKVLPSHHHSWAAVAIVFLDYPGDVAPTWLKVDGTKATFTWPDQWQRSLVVMPAAASVEFASPVKLAFIPVLGHPRSVHDYYIGSAIWQAFVSSHRASTVLGMNFFRRHSKHPLYWHAWVWSFIGAALLTLSAIPFLYKPLNRLAMAIHNRMSHGKSGDDERVQGMIPGVSEAKPKPYMGTLLRSHQRSINGGNGDGEVPSMVAGVPDAKPKPYMGTLLRSHQRSIDGGKDHHTLIHGIRPSKTQKSDL